VPLGIAGPLFGPHAVAAVIALYTVGTAVSALGGPAWGSLLADYIAPEERGAYFGRRARLAGVSTTLAGLVAGSVLQLAARGTAGFAALCFGAGVSRAFSWRALFALHDRGWRDEPHLRFGFVRFLARTPQSNFARFSLCLALSSFAAHVSAPYFAVYLLEEAGYSYASYTLVILSGAITGTLCSPWWGQLSDRVGNHAVMRWTLAGVSVLPALWLVSPHPLWMVGANVLGAFLWGGLNLSAANFVYDAVSAPKRHTCIAYFNVLNGLGVSAGALAGGLLYDALAGVHPAPYVVVFYASVALRMVAMLAFQNAVREVRPVRPVGLREVVLDLVGQRLVGLLGFLSVRPEQEFPRRGLPDESEEDLNAADDDVAARATDP
jgi:MFS family permease